jgi:hypothetical protein
MTTTVEFGQDPETLAGFEAAHAHDQLPQGFETQSPDGLYQDIESRRAQTENPDVLRRARSL